MSACLAAEIARTSDFDVHVVSPTDINGPATEIRGNITIHWVKSPVILPPVLSYWTILRSRLHKELERIAPDITHFQGIGGWTIGYSRPYILTIHGIAERDILFSTKPAKAIRKTIIRSVEQYARKRTKNFVIINPYVKKVLSDSIRGRCWSIENPVNRIFFSKHRSDFANTIVFAGRITPIKNVLQLLRAFRIALRHNPALHLVIAGPTGDAQYYQSCRQFAVKHQLENHVRYTGPLTPVELAELLSKAGCLVLPSLQENAPLVISEAMAVGTPIVASDVGGIRYMIQNNVNGFLCDPLFEEQIAASLTRAMSDRSVNYSIGAHNRELALETYHPSQVAQKTIAAYFAILKQIPNNPQI